MSLRKLPEIKALDQPTGYTWDVPSDALARWSETPQAAEADDPNTISIYDVIGEDMWSGGGFTAKRMAGALRAIGAKEVNVKINSPGGNVFDGLAIYNLLREHPAKVTIDVMGIAASAASVIAMAGDEVRMGLGTFLMIHNAWGVVVGNRNDLAAAVDTLAQIDGAMADIYVARTGMKQKDVAALMDAETYLGANDAIDRGFADTATQRAAPAAKASAVTSGINAKRRLDALLAQQGVPRGERRRLLKEAILGTHDAAPETVTHDADHTVAAKQLTELLKSFRDKP